MPLIFKKLSLIIMLWAAGLLAGAQFAKVSVLLPEIRELYPIHEEQVAWLLTLVSIVGAFFGGVAGTVANRLGQKHILVASLLSAGGLSMWQSTFPDFGIMALSRILEGITHLGIVVTAPALMAHLSSEKWRGAAMALWSTFFGVSFALFAWFGIPIAMDIEVKGLFQLHGASLLVLAGITHLFLPSSEGAVTDPSTPPESRASLLDTYKEIRITWPGVGWFFYTLTFLSLLTILPSQMPDDLRPQMTTTMSMVGIGISLLVVPMLLLKLNATTVVLSGFGLAALTVGLGFGMNLLALAVLLFAILGAVQGGAFAAVAELNRSMSKRTLGYGFMAQTGNLGNLVGTPFLLIVLENSGQDSLLLLTCGIYSSGLLLLLVLARRIRAYA